MIVTVAATVALGAPSREVLIERWLHANRTHSAARLESALRRPVSQQAAPDLGALAKHELGIPGRYQLVRSLPSAATQPWWRRALQWLADRWQWFWRTIFSRVHVGKEQAASIGDLLLVVILLLLLFVAARLLRNLQFSRSNLRTNAAPLAEAPSPDFLYKRACDAASRGEYGNAAVLLFTATVGLLDRRGAVKAGGSATVGDLRRELRAADAALVEPFDAVAGPFVEKAYAERSVAQPQWDRARDAFDRLAQEGAP